MDALLAEGQAPADPAERFRVLEAWASRAAASGALLLAVPTGFFGASPDAPGGELRRRLAAAARRAGVALAAATPEQAPGGVYAAASLWDRHGQLAGHTRARRPSAALRARGFRGFAGPPPVLRAPGLPPLAVAHAPDARAADYRAYLSAAGASVLVVLGEADTALEPLAGPAPWNATRTGVPFPQPGPLPEPLLRPLPRDVAAWYARLEEPEPRPPRTGGS